MLNNARGETDDHAWVYVSQRMAPAAAQAREIADLAGGVGRIIERALAKLEAREFALDSHLIDLAVAAEPDDKAAHEARTKIYAARAIDSRSTMAHGIFRAAAVESAAKAGIMPPEDHRRFQALVQCVLCH